jgi:TolB protein
VFAGLAPRVEDQPTRLTTDGLEKQRPAWSPDGKRLLFARHEEGGTAIRQYVMEPGAPSSLRRVTDRKAPEHGAVFSPDGSRLLMTIITLSGTQGNLDIVSLAVDGTDLKVVARDRGGLSHQDWPAWSPDGSKFAFSSTHDKNQEIYVTDRDGGNLARLTQHPGLDAHPCWSPEGEWIAFSTDRWQGLELARMRPDGSQVERLTTSPGLNDYPSYSPDGRRIAFVSNRDGNYEVYVALADGSQPVNLTRHPARDTFPAWSADGSAITFVSDRSGVGTDLYAIRP